MTTAEPFTSLPPVRKKVFLQFMILVGLYFVVGVFMTIAVFLASGITPKAIHRNYDSISAALQMREAWSALRNPGQYSQKHSNEWNEQFHKAIEFENKNITEIGEANLAKKIQNLWDLSVPNLSKIDQPTFGKMNDYLTQLIDINEQGMFEWAREGADFGHKILMVTIVIFLATLLAALYLADSLAVRIANPLRELSAALKRQPEPGSKLKVPKPTTLEMRILSQALLNLWERVSDLQKLNLVEISTQRSKLETVLSSVDDAILVLGNQDQIVHCNEGMSKLLGVEANQIVDLHWLDLSSMEHNYLKLREVLKPDIANGRSVDLIIGGSARTFSGRSRAIFSDKKLQIGTLYLLHDITESKHRERLKAEFIGVLSHELKTPLQSLGTAAELLFKRKDMLDDDGKMLIETIHEDVGRIRGVANEFVQVGLADLQSLRLKIEPVQLNVLLKHCIQPFLLVAKDKNVDVEFVSEGTESILAKVDNVKFPWAVSNLLANAIRVSSANSKVTVYLTDKNERIEIEVRDHGPGIPSEMSQKIFDPYFQSNHSAGEKTSGFLGLGLTIAKEVAEAHDGKLEYFPGTPDGSVFRITLPQITEGDK